MTLEDVRKLTHCNNCKEKLGAEVVTDSMCDDCRCGLDDMDLEDQFKFLLNQ